MYEDDVPIYDIYCAICGGPLRPPRHNPARAFLAHGYLDLLMESSHSELSWLAEFCVIGDSEQVDQGPKERPWQYVSYSFLWTQANSTVFRVWIDHNATWVSRLAVSPDFTEYGMQYPAPFLQVRGSPWYRLLLWY